MIFKMQKFISYLVVAAMITLTTLSSCGKDDKHSNNDKCPCLYRDAQGAYLGSDEPISMEIIEALNFIMYPNPTSNEVYLEFKTDSLNTVTIIDKKGKVLFEQSSEFYHMVIDVSYYPEGKYRVTVDNGKQKSALCLIKH
jgi:hypothetical protein